MTGIVKAIKEFYDKDVSFEIKQGKAVGILLIFAGILLTFT